MQLLCVLFQHLIDNVFFKLHQSSHLILQVVSYFVNAIIVSRIDFPLSKTLLQGKYWLYFVLMFNPDSKFFSVL